MDIFTVYRSHAKQSNLDFFYILNNNFSRSGKREVDLDKEELKEAIDEIWEERLSDSESKSVCRCDKMNILIDINKVGEMTVNKIELKLCELLNELKKPNNSVNKLKRYTHYETHSILPCTNANIFCNYQF